MKDSADEEIAVDPAAVELAHVSDVTIDVGRLLQAQAAAGQPLNLDGLESDVDLADSATVAPLLGLVARSVRSALDVLELDHLRILMLLSQRDGISLAELSRLTALPSRKLAIVLDSMESAEWITTSRPARGIGEMVAISGPGTELAGQVIRKRQDEIDDILARMTDEDRATLARAFSAFAAAAAEPTLRKPKAGLQP